MPPPSPAQRVPCPEMYPPPPVHPVHPGRENVMARPPIVYGPGYYGPPSHYNKYSPHHQQHHHNPNEEVRYRGPRQHNRPHYHHHHPELSYEVKMSYLEELGISLDECRDQLRHLERDCKKV